MWGMCIVFRNPKIPIQAFIKSSAFASQRIPHCTNDLQQDSTSLTSMQLKWWFPYSLRTCCPRHKGVHWFAQNTGRAPANSGVPKGLSPVPCPQPDEAGPEFLHNHAVCFPGHSVILTGSLQGGFLPGPIAQMTHPYNVTETAKQGTDLSCMAVTSRWWTGRFSGFSSQYLRLRAQWRTSGHKASGCTEWTPGSRGWE